MKRMFDILISSIGVLLLAPFLILIAIWVKLDSKGPVLYIQERVGKDGRMFPLLKFRTMHVNSDRLTPITVGKRDPRVTRAGSFLRKWKLDELPQLINVVKGDMSLVGPRPELKKFVDLYTETQRKVLSVRPGLTDYASIEFRHESEMLEGKDDPVEYYVKEILPAKLALNLKYVERQSLLRDIAIIFKTVLAVVGWRK
jgi:lipopolysaccharide/colanic/teichoic acid biosynthesis glycosyltransferase